jgi:hypothetical protein
MKLGCEFKQLLSGLYVRFGAEEQLQRRKILSFTNIT